MTEMNMPAFNFRENYLKFLNHESTPVIPDYLASNAVLGCGVTPGPWIEGGPLGGGLDGFGVEWIAPASGGGAPMPKPNQFVLDDICDWREKVTIPDVDIYDWKAAAEADLARVDRSAQVVDFCVGFGVFQRLTALMGFEEALIAMATEPEEVAALFDAITEYHLNTLDRVVKYYKPDVVTYGDDIATELALFMSPQCYRELIKPHHKRFADACKAYGVIPVYHCCGHAESIIEDMIDCGWQAWTSCQISNDISGLIEKYGDKIGFIGGWDSNGKPATPEATDEEVIAEIRRAYDTYGKAGKSFAFFGYRNVNTLDPATLLQSTMFIVQESVKYSFERLIK